MFCNRHHYGLITKNLEIHQGPVTQGFVFISHKENRAKDGTLFVMIVTNTSRISSLFIIKTWKILMITIEQNVKSALFS